jgi:hypothetical protein
MSDYDDESKAENLEESESQSMDKMEELLDSNFMIDFPKAGEIRDGIIASISEGQSWSALVPNPKVLFLEKSTKVSHKKY